MRPGIVTQRQSKRPDLLRNNNAAGLRKKKRSDATSKYNGVHVLSGEKMAKGGRFAKTPYGVAITINGKRYAIHNLTDERAAAIEADKIYIEHRAYGKLNILKLVQK